MKGKFKIQGKTEQLPFAVSTTYKLRDNSTAKLSLNKMGDYFLSVPSNPYMENAARISPYYKQAISELTKRMVDAMDAVVSSYTNILEKCIMPQSLSLYKKRLEDLQLKRYARQPFHINQPTKESVMKELEMEGQQKFYSLFRSNARKIDNYVKENLENAFSSKLKQWNEVKLFFELVESTIEKKENEKYQQEYDKTKNELENFIYGPDSFVASSIREKCPGLTLPTDVNVTYDYNQQEGLIDVQVTVPDKLQVSLPTQKFSLSSIGKLQVRPRTAAEMDFMYTDFYIGIAFYVASSLFQITANIKNIRVSLVNAITNQYILWLSFDRERFSVINYKKAEVLNEAQTIPNVLILRGNKIESLDKGKFYSLVQEAIDVERLKPFSQKTQKNHTINISIEDAKLLSSHYPIANSILKQIQDAEMCGQSTLKIDQRYEGTLNELREAQATMQLPLSNTMHKSQETIDQTVPTARKSSNIGLAFQPSEQIGSQPLNGESFGVRGEEYSKAKLSDTKVNPDDISNGLYETEIKEMIYKLVNVEAPISKSMLFRITLSHFGIGRVGSRLSGYMESLIKQMNLLIVGNTRPFIWKDGQNINEYGLFRINSGRDATDIAPQEVSNAMLSILQRRKVIREDELCRETAHLFSFTRMGTNVVTSMNDGLFALYDRNLGIKDGDLVRIRPLSLTINSKLDI